MEKIKSCPFCGGTPKLIHVSKNGASGSQIGCTCGIVGNWFSVSPSYSSDEMAITHWNKRDIGIERVKQVYLLELLKQYEGFIDEIDDVMLMHKSNPDFSEKQTLELIRDKLDAFFNNRTKCLKDYQEMQEKVDDERD